MPQSPKPNPRIPEDGGIKGLDPLSSLSPKVLAKQGLDGGIAGLNVLGSAPSMKDDPLKNEVIPQSLLPSNPGASGLGGGGGMRGVGVTGAISGFVDPLGHFDGTKPLDQQLTVARLDSLTDLVRSNIIQPGRGVTISRVGGGVAVNVRRRRGGGGSPTIFPLQPGGDVSDNSNPKYTITYGTWAGFVPTISGTALVVSTAANIITLGPSDGAVYIQFDGTYDATGIITLIDAQIMSAAAGAVPTPNVVTGSGSGGNITVYQELFGVTITAPVGMGPYTVAAAPAVGGSQNIQICNPSSVGPSLSGPFGV